MLVLATEEHARLDALLKKMVDLVPYLNDVQSEALLTIVVKFCRAGLEKQAAWAENKFLELDIEQLIETTTTKKNKNKKKEQDAEEEMEEDEEPEDRNVQKKKRKEENSTSVDKTRWSLSEASNIVGVLSIDQNPFVIRLLAKPPVAGNRRPVEFVMNEDDFDSISSMTGRPANKLKATLRTRLVEFCSKNEEHAFAMAKLIATPWGNVE